MTTVKPNRGRGQVAPYQTTHVRVSLPIKAEVEKLVARYKESQLLEIGEQRLTSVNAAEVAREILKHEKSAKASMNKLLTKLYRVDFQL
jgi:hypothetical protein